MNSLCCRAVVNIYVSTFNDCSKLGLDYNTSIYLKCRYSKLPLFMTSLPAFGQGSICLVEQIIAYVRRIVQIMIQATDLAHILYRVHPLRKKRGPRKISIWPPFSNMVATGYPEILFFALKGQQMVEKDNYDDEFYVLTIANVQIML